MRKVSALLLWKCAICCTQIDRSSRSDGERVLFEHNGVMHIYDLSAQEIVERIAPPMSRFSVCSSARDPVQGISEKESRNSLGVYKGVPESADSGEVREKGVLGRTFLLQGIVSEECAQGIAHRDGLKASRHENSLRQQVKSRRNASEVGAEYLGESPGKGAEGGIQAATAEHLAAEFGISGGKLPDAIVSDGMVVSREKRLGVEYLASQAGVLVCVYNEVVTRVFKPARLTEYITREITTILGSTVITRTSMHQNTIRRIHEEYNAKIYLLKKMDGMLYFSEVVISELEENRAVLLRRALQSLQNALLLVFLGFLLVPMGIRIFGYRDTPIRILQGAYYGFRKGLLFGKKPVYVIVLSKKPESGASAHGRIQAMNASANAGLHTEEDRGSFYIAYPADLRTLSDALAEGAAFSDLMRRLFARVQGLHRQGVSGIPMEIHSVYINRSAIVFLEGRSTKERSEKEKNETSSKSPKKDTDFLRKRGPGHEQVRGDYAALGKLCYTLHCVQHRGTAQCRPFSEALEEIMQYNYREHPRLILDSNTKQKIELFDWICSLLCNSVAPEIPHPVFWTPQQSLEFLSLFSDYVFDHPSEQVIETSKISQKLECDWSNWDVYLDVDLLEDLTRSGRYYYNTKSTRDLLRLIRNNGRHFQSIPESGRAHFNNDLATYIAYFLSRYPYIVLFSYYIAGEHGLHNEKFFLDIFQQQ
ncbi:uncharacterized protein NEMAJ01_2209 [Nematocida major]|uniref:uncharacterized protein n=1 Tax=Nematocida major TaxID=1912982 RepID=UPI0020073C7F|nr:uncharacterized protein NEMAJ01_2209 [Nematocida major]KAH9387313.1 hypothetical protein NEMAJ01_2209 [Nematocida major]